ncbi:Oidioi.mRNA.OKI2018_I69.chr2.g8366.t1.cds [Oikopleura dioica]|uniref:Oidioi.mRNA.OKI2018_I69.chr2.g8366.t1.cds n=1 Tax=Oikopleura dioica TaxID=34765 RepID=A0ABN7T915_OIKDI|nr:Oidioi.mRNA.OKI2018_I69.chr2.g8366.t1.cds [Oikopleura dioica]
MGYTRRGSKYRYGNHLYAGTIAFCKTSNIIARSGENNNSIFAFILSRWPTAWKLLFAPIKNEQIRKDIRNKLITIKADWLNTHSTMADIKDRHINGVEEIIFLQNRLKYETYLNNRGWEIISEIGHAKGNFDYKPVTLHKGFQFDDRPLTVTCGYLPATAGVPVEKDIFYHQMTLESVQSGNYVLQNTYENYSRVTIPVDRTYLNEFEQAHLQMRQETCPPASTAKNKMSYKSVIDYYAILGVQPSATLKDITSAYRKLAKEKHPDKNPNDPRAKEKFIKLKEAFDFLQKRDACNNQIFDFEKAKKEAERRKSGASGLTPNLAQERIKEKRRDHALWKLGPKGGVGHFVKIGEVSDKSTIYGGVRDEMKGMDLINILKLLSLGAHAINLKFSYEQKIKVTNEGWELEFKGASRLVGDGGNGWNYLWFKIGGEYNRFFVVAQEINGVTGEELNRKEITSRTDRDGRRQLVMYEMTTACDFVRFNITFFNE